MFKEELGQVKEGMKQVNDLAHQLAISDVHLSMENARALEHLNSRWKVLQVRVFGLYISFSLFCSHMSNISWHSFKLEFFFVCVNIWTFEFEFYYGVNLLIRNADNFLF